MPLRRFLPDPFICALLGTVLLASVLPCRGETASVFGGLTDAAIALLFFLHGAKLSREAALAGLKHWRLHACVLASTFVLFPLLGWALKPLLQPLVTPDLYLGVLFLCCVPSTVQSSIAFTSMACGNVPAAVCAASASSLLGIFLTPLLAGLILAAHGHAGTSWDAVGGIVLQLLAPFVAGQVAQRWIGGWVRGHKPLVGLVDQGSILLVVYSAFSAAVLQGLAGDALRRARVALWPRGRNHPGVLRLQEKPGQRHPDGQGAVRRHAAGRDRAAVDAVPPDPADDLRSAGATLCAARRGGGR